MNEWTFMLIPKSHLSELEAPFVLSDKVKFSQVVATEHGTWEVVSLWTIPRILTSIEIISIIPLLMLLPNSNCRALTFFQVPSLDFSSNQICWVLLGDSLFMGLFVSLAVNQSIVGVLLHFAWKEGVLNVNLVAPQLSLWLEDEIPRKENNNLDGAIKEFNFKYLIDHLRCLLIEEHRSGLPVITIPRIDLIMVF